MGIILLKRFFIPGAPKNKRNPYKILNGMLIHRANTNQFRYDKGSGNQPECTNGYMISQLRIRRAGYLIICLR